MRISAVLALLLWAAPAFADDAVQELEHALTSAPSATQFLTDRCESLKLASPPLIKAVRENIDVKPGAEVRAALKVGADAVLRYRRVDLTCGSHVLSQADNWYVPERLTPEMNRILDTTETSFGTVVKPLDFHRKTLKMEPADDGDHLFRVTAVLLTADDMPFSLVVENYSSALVGGRR